MKTKNIIVLIGFMFIFLTSFKCFGSIDEVQLKLIQEYKIPLRWHNIETKPEWVCGVKPVYNFKHKIHIVHLKPSQEVIIRIPPHEMLRIIGLTDSILAKELEVSVSNGSGLYAYLPVYKDKHNNSLLINPATRHQVLSLIKLPEHCQTSIDIGIFISQKQYHTTLAPYRKLIDLNLTKVNLSEIYQYGNTPFWFFEANQPVEIEITGPVQLSLENRFIYPKSESKRVQNYQIIVKIDEKLHQILEFTTQPETKYQIKANSRPKLTGRLETAYIKIPKGRHILELQALASMYARLLLQEQPDYLLPKLNAPKFLKQNTQDVSEILKKSIWQIQDKELENIVQSPKNSLSIKENSALRTIKDNTRQEGGILGSMLLHQEAHNNQNYPQIQKNAEKLTNIHTFYRNLLPVKKLTSTDQKFYYFNTPELKNPYEKPRETIAYKQHADDLINTLASAYFIEIADQEKTIYKIPDRSCPVLLRIIISDESDVKQNFMVQFDDNPPVKFRILENPKLPENEYQISSAQMGLLILKLQHQKFDLKTLGGPYGINKNPGKLIKAKIFELSLAPDIKSVKIFKSKIPKFSKRQKNNLVMALQYKASKPYLLSETQYLNLTKNLQHQEIYKSFINLISENNKHEKNLSSEYEFFKKEISNHQVHLLRFIHSQAKAFSSSFFPEKTQNFHNILKSDIKKLIYKAKELEKSNQWILALELWEKIANTKFKQDAKFKSIDALLHLGEDYLAKRLLKGIFLFEKNKFFQQKAFEKLENLYIQQKDDEALISLYCQAFIKYLQPDYLISLVKTLVQKGDYQMALTAGLVLPKSQQPVETMLCAAFHENWWDVFDKLKLRINDNKKRNYWTGQKACKTGHYYQAFKYFNKAGLEGRLWKNFIKQGIGIYLGISSKNFDKQLKAVIDWEKWQDKHPGHFIWKPAYHLIKNYDGTELLYNISRDLYMQSFKATKLRPVKLKVMGPVNLRFDTRPLHVNNSETPINSWIQIKESEKLHIIPINRNIAGSNMKITGTNQWKPGRKITSLYYVGPGLHDIEIYANDIALLINIYQSLPHIKTGVLPQLTLETLSALIPSLKENPDLMNNFLNHLESIRQSSLTLAEKQAKYLAKGQINKALKLFDNNNEDILKHMILLVWLAEKYPNKYMELLVRAENLFAKYPETPGIAPLFHRISKHSKWMPVNLIQNSAGFRYADIQGWNPESPSLRIRKAILGTLDVDNILYDEKELVLSLTNLQKTNLEISLTIHDLGYLPPNTVSVAFQLNENPEKLIFMNSQKPEHIFSIPVNAGEHYIRIGINNRVENQFLKIKIWEIKKGKKISKKTTLISQQKLIYHIATKYEPVYFELEGPLRLRIDELRSQKIFSSYKDVGSGWHKIKLIPDSSQNEALFRVFKKVFNADKSQTPARIIKYEPKPVKKPLFKIIPAQNTQYGIKQYIAIKDKYPLGGQEDGTWTFGTNFSKPRNVQEDHDQDNSEDFFEINAAYHYFHEYKQTYFSSQILSRIRKQGKPTFGFKENIYYMPPYVPFHFRLTGQLYLQNPESKLTDTQWSAFLQGTMSQTRKISPKSYHSPYMSIFARYLSLDNNPYESQNLDQDIFTPYKADHKTGLRIGDTFILRPWLDTIWFAGGFAGFNEDYNLFEPDHFSLKTGWKQLAGQFQLNGLYQYTHYFEDDDRDNSIDRHILGLELQWEKWISWQNRLESGIKINHELKSNETSGMIFFLWHYGNARIYKDFRPGKIDFKDIKTRNFYKNE